MRRRLLASMLAITIATVALFGIPLAFVLARVVHDDAQARLQRDATRVARQIDSSALLSLSDAQVIDELRHLVPVEDGVLVQFPDGRRIATTHIKNPLSESVPGPQNTVVTLQSPAEDLNQRVHRAQVVLLGLALASIGAALALAIFLSRRLADPLDRLARSATRLGDGDFSLATPRSGIPEMDEIGVALDSSARRIERLLRTERSFSTHASHQLRSAITGLELRLDELASYDDPAVRAEASAALDQTHRLNATVDELLTLARTGRAGIVMEFDLADLARKHAADASVALARDGRRLVVDAPGPARVVAAVGALGQAMDILLSNARMHGRGTVTVRVCANERHVIVEVGDQGPGPSPDTRRALFDEKLGADGHGIGLPLARTLVTAEGGTIELAQPTPPVFLIRLPRA